MRNFLLYLCFILLTLSSTESSAKMPIDSLLKVLDKELTLVPHYDQKKKEQITYIKSQITNSHTDEELYMLRNQLYKEYETFVYDSAYKYINQNLTYCLKKNNKQLTNDCLMKKAYILMISGLYEESMNVLHKVDRSTLNETQRIDYYKYFENFYLYKTEYSADKDFMQEYIGRTRQYRDTLLSLIHEKSYNYVIIKFAVLVDNNKVDEAISLLKSYLTKATPDTRPYAILTSDLAYSYGKKNDIEQQKYYLLLSAISDIRASNKETNSIRMLAEILLKENDVERAFKYLNMSVDEANHYHARLRNLQAVKLIPLLTHRNEIEREKRENQLWLFLIIMMLVVVIVSGLLIYSYIVTRRLRHSRRTVVQANKEIHNKNEALEQSNSELRQATQKQQKANELQKETNRKLTESNTIKEEYIGRFLILNSSYIDSSDSFRKELYKLAQKHKLEELFSHLKTNARTEKYLNEFYQNFDSAFLKIFPRFVECFNALLPEAEAIIPKKEGALNTELRIFALIRLGITDSNQIANILHSSITTIYTYRSKMKNKSLFADSFEKRVIEIDGW